MCYIPIGTPPVWTEGCVWGCSAGRWSRTPRSGCSSGSSQGREDTLPREWGGTVGAWREEAPTAQPSHLQTGLKTRGQNNVQNSALTTELSSRCSGFTSQHITRYLTYMSDVISSGHLIIDMLVSMLSRHASHHLVSFLHHIPRARGFNRHFDPHKGYWGFVLVWKSECKSVSAIITSRYVVALNGQGRWTRCSHRNPKESSWNLENIKRCVYIAPFIKHSDHLQKSRWLVTTCNTHIYTLMTRHQEHLGLQCLAQGHLDMIQPVGIWLPATLPPVCSKRQC